MKATKNQPYATINNADERLAGLLAEYQLDNYETRSKSKGGDSLYIRMKKIVQPIQLAFKPNTGKHA